MENFLSDVFYNLDQLFGKNLLNCLFMHLGGFSSKMLNKLSKNVRGCTWFKLSVFSHRGQGGLFSSWFLFLGWISKNRKP